MKTTLDLDNSLHLRAKMEAARKQMSLTRFIEEAVRRQLDGPGMAAKRPLFRIKARDLGMKPAFRSMRMNKLAAQLEDESILAAGCQDQPS